MNCRGKRLHPKDRQPGYVTSYRLVFMTRCVKVSRVDLWRGQTPGMSKKTLNWRNAPLSWKSAMQVLRLSQNLTLISTQGLRNPKKTFLYTETFLDTQSPAVYNCLHDRQYIVRKNHNPSIRFSFAHNHKHDTVRKTISMAHVKQTSLLLATRRWWWRSSLLGVPTPPLTC